MTADYYELYKAAEAEAERLRERLKEADERVRQAFLAGELAMKQRVKVAIGPPLSLDEDERAKLVELLMSGGEL